MLDAECDALQSPTDVHMMLPLIAAFTPLSFKLDLHFQVIDEICVSENWVICHEVVISFGRLPGCETSGT